MLTLECSECGKPCRSQTEQDLHTKRTGHATFRDKVLGFGTRLTLQRCQGMSHHLLAFLTGCQCSLSAWRACYWQRLLVFPLVSL